jgi:hypothetical protein
MPNSVAATRLKRYTSIARNVAASVAGVGSADTITLYHGLARTPHEIRVTPRTVRAAVSGWVPPLVVVSMNASVAVISAPPAGAWDGLFDIVSQFVYSTGQ